MWINTSVGYGVCLITCEMRLIKPKALNSLNPNQSTHKWKNEREKQPLTKSYRFPRPNRQTLLNNTIFSHPKPDKVKLSIFIGDNVLSPARHIRLEFIQFANISQFLDFLHDVVLPWLVLWSAGLCLKWSV